MDLKKKSRLGRGLSSLMGMNQPAEGELPVHATVESRTESDPLHGGMDISAPRGTPLEVPLSQIDPNPHQPRRQFTDSSLAELAESIKSNGIIQPVILKPVGDRYQLIAGERRMRAAQLAGLTTLPAIIHTADELAQAQMALVENIQREDLNPMDRAAGYRTLISELGVSQTELASRLGEERATIANHLRLLELDPSVADMVRAGTLSLGHAKVLCGISDHADQRRLAAAVEKGGLSVRALEKLIAEPALPGDPAPRTPPSAHLKELELSLSRQLGIRVQVRPGATKSKGKMVLNYNTLDEFDSIVARLGVKLEE